jgi:hypothetical protein
MALYTRKRPKRITCIKCNENKGIAQYFTINNGTGDDTTCKGCYEKEARQRLYRDIMPPPAHILTMANIRWSEVNIKSFISALERGG